MADIMTKLHTARRIQEESKPRIKGAQCSDALKGKGRDRAPSKRKLNRDADLFLAKHGMLDMNTNFVDPDWMKLPDDIDPELPDLSAQADAADENVDLSEGVTGIIYEASLLGVHADGCSKCLPAKLERSKEHSQMEMAVNSRLFSETDVPTATGRIRPFTKQDHMRELFA